MAMLVPSTILRRLCCCHCLLQGRHFHCHCAVTLLPSTPHFHPDACCHCCHDYCHWQCCWLVSLSLCGCRRLSLSPLLLLLLSLSPSPSPSHCRSISNSISDGWLLFKYFILALLSSLLLSLSPAVWHVCWVLKRFSETLVVRSKITSIDDRFSSPRFPMFLYVLPTSRSRWPANV